MTRIKPRLLIVDDDVSTIHLMSSILSDLAEIFIATKGEKAFQIARNNVPDIILLDAEMPGMDGFSLCTALKSCAATADCVVIFVTAHSNIDYETRALELGAVDFISKPISPPILRARVQMHLTLKRQTDDLKRLNQNLEERVSERTHQLETANQELRSTRDAAMAATRAKSDFLAMMSHELRTPMNGIIGMIDLLLRTELSEAQRKYAKIVSDASQALLEMINDILDYSQTEAGQVKLEFMEFDVREIVYGPLLIMKRDAERKNLAFVFNISENIPPTLSGDGARIRQILFNVVGNAIKFTERGGVHVTIAYESVATAPFLEIVVRDTGIGITPEVRTKVFEKFTQGDASFSRRYGGAGLGLAIAKQLCDLMGGSISFDSNPGNGSTFSILIPCSSSEDKQESCDVAA